MLSRPLPSCCPRGAGGAPHASARGLADGTMVVVVELLLLLLLLLLFLVVVVGGGGGGGGDNDDDIVGIGCGIG